MEKSTCSLAVAFRAACIAMILGALSGCFASFRQPPAVVVTKSETEIAVEAIKDEWLVACPGVTGPMPTNTTGNLLQDYNNVAAAGGECMARHNNLVDYLRPFVAKEKARKLTPAAK